MEQGVIGGDETQGILICGLVGIAGVVASAYFFLALVKGRARSVHALAIYARLGGR